MYANGTGTIQDYTRARMWWNIAASQGDKNVLKNQDIVTKNMFSTHQESKQSGPVP